MPEIKSIIGDATEKMTQPTRNAIMISKIGSTDAL